MLKVSTKAVIKALTNASSSRGSYVPQKLKTFLSKTKISHPVFGSQRVQDALKKSDIDQKKLTEIFKKAKEQGVLRQTSSTKSENEFYKSATKQERLTRQFDQKNQEVAQKTIKPKDEKVLNIAQAQKETAKAERWRGAALGGEKAIRGMERVYAGGEKYRKQQVATSGLLKSRGGGGMAAEGKSAGLLNKAMEEEKDEKNSPKGSKSGQKGGGSVPAGQKSGGHQPVKLQGSAGIDQLTHRQEISKNENLPGGFYHVDGLNNKKSVSQSETPPAPRSASALEDITDLDIG